MKRRTKKLRVIPEPLPGTASVLSVLSDGPVVQSEGDTDFVCGSCGHLLLKAVASDQVRNLVVHCSRCKAFNAVMPGGKTAN